MRYIAAVLALIPAVVAAISDPDELGIGILVIVLVGLYIAFRTKLVGGIILIVIGALMLVFFFINLLSPDGIPGGILGFLTWIMFIVFPAISGILFVLAGKKKVQKQTPVAPYST